MPGTGSSGGRNVKTAKQHRLEGTFQKVRHAGFTNPEPPKGRPESPKKLAGEAKSEWDRMIVRLEANGTLAKTDDAALYQYCRLFAETEDLARLRDETGASVAILEENLSGLEGADLVACFQEISKLRQLESRYAVQIRQGRMAQRMFLQEFGLTPASRGRVKLPERQNDDPFSEFEEPGGIQ